MERTSYEPRQVATKSLQVHTVGRAEKILQLDSGANEPSEKKIINENHKGSPQSKGRKEIPQSTGSCNPRLECR